MLFFHKIYYRVYQSVIYVASMFLNFREPLLATGEGSLRKIPALLAQKDFRSILIVTDDALFKLGLLDELEDILNSARIKYFIYHDVTPNPTIDQIEDGLMLYQKQKAQAIIAFGGGSSIDCAKGIAARVSNPELPIEKMRGILRVKHRPVYVMAIPTTAGTGSEATVACVVTNPKTHEKYALNDPKLIPEVAILEPKLLAKLPGKITSTTGMDALTHAVEAYTNKFQTRKTRRKAKAAVSTIFAYLKKSFDEPNVLEYRNKMQIAAYDAGVAFTRGYVGYVHAIAHTLGGFYGVPHGLANAIILPHVLGYFGPAVYRRLAELADEVGIVTNENTQLAKAEAFINAIKELNASMAIPEQFDNVIKEEDIELMIDRAMKEAHPLYPVPAFFDRNDFRKLYHLIQK